MRVCITGGAGFIGSAVAAAALARGDEVTVLDDLSAGRAQDIPEGARLVVGDVRSRESVRAAAAEADAILHLAAYVDAATSFDDPERVDAINAGGTERICEVAAESGARVVFASSCAVYGDRGAAPIREDAPLAPASPYALSKMRAEEVCARADADVAIVRFFNVYGPGQRAGTAYAAVVPAFIGACRRGDTPVIYGDGTQTRDLVYVGDVARAILLAASLPATPVRGRAPVNIGSGTAISVGELLGMIAAACGVESVPRYAPARLGDLMHSTADVMRAREVLGWVPEVSLAEGIARTVESFRKAN